MAGLHVIVKNTVTERVRLRGVFTDEQFFNLPLVKTFGAFPSGMCAFHFDENPESVGYQFAMAIPESPVSAEVELRLLNRAAKRARYVVEHGDERLYFPSIKAATDHVERLIVGRWLSVKGPRGGYSNRAPKVTRYGDRPNEAGNVVASWSLRRGKQAHGFVKIRRLDARGSLAYADQFNKREVA